MAPPTQRRSQRYALDNRLLPHKGKEVCAGNTVKVALTGREENAASSVVWSQVCYTSLALVN